jgi:two-component system response regulator YesN
VKVSVLFADDKQIERKGMISMLQKMPFESIAYEARNGAEALEILKDKMVQILVTDIRMPVMDGNLLIEEVAKTYPEIRIIICSAYADFSYAQKAIGFGVESYLLKPIRFSEFQETLGKVYDACVKIVSPASGENESHYSKQVAQVIQIIRHKYASPKLSLDYLADEVYLSPNYLSNIFKKETGAGISKYISAYRMEKACEVLSGTLMKISDVAESVGFSNYSYFVTAFKGCYGISPLEYRNKHEKE